MSGVVDVVQSSDGFHTMLQHLWCHLKHILSFIRISDDQNQCKWSWSSLELQLWPSPNSPGPANPQVLCAPTTKAAAAPHFAISPFSIIQTFTCYVFIFHIVWIFQSNSLTTWTASAAAHFAIAPFSITRRPRAFSPVSPSVRACYT